ncbi:MAG TPA: division/cell wall cluster transcriptional repressor MraZ [bacterium]|nr:division/cell wall cluster transcriptional repressor MraZ [bacterium]HMW33922.1 division/cell wall cluster transcriptional repressor MraZ [bacterium]HMW37145.1 division/cell wall cluster transcriptional repressor MraZ [bacterium]HMY35473.1 division/cell wall cluster transcriptional repressor MraZ [bacterium]HMZ04537.1 division/cell wall cluster transcriptional repressor MraZ [bacterium]
MPSFKGTYNHILDSKNRFNIPAKMRSAFVPEDKDTVILTRGFEQCIYMYPYSEWLRREDELRQLSNMDSDARKLVRLLMGFAQECELDKQGRVIIPQPLLSFAGIEKEIVIIGALERMEAWNPKQYDAAHNGFDLETTAAKFVKF